MTRAWPGAVQNRQGPHRPVPPTSSQPVSTLERSRACPGQGPGPAQGGCLDSLTPPCLWPHTPCPPRLSLFSLCSSPSSSFSSDSPCPPRKTPVPCPLHPLFKLAGSKRNSRAPPDCPECWPLPLDRPPSCPGRGPRLAAPGGLWPPLKLPLWRLQAPMVPGSPRAERMEACPTLGSA